MKILTFKKTVTVLVATGFAVSLAACGKQAEAPKKATVSKDTATITLDFENVAVGGHYDTLWNGHRSHALHRLSHVRNRL